MLMTALWVIIIKVHISQWRVGKLWQHSAMFFPDSKVHGANMGPTWVLSAPCGPHVGPMNLTIWVRMAANQGVWYNLCGSLDMQASNTAMSAHWPYTTHLFN